MSAVNALLRTRAFRRLMVGQTVSALGDWVATVGLMVLALQVSGSSAAVGGILVLRLAPAAVAAPLAAAVVRRFDRRATLLAMDAARAVMAVALPLLPGVWWAAPGWLPPLAWVYVWAVLIEVAGLLFLPARDSAVPEIVADGDLGIANGLVLGSSYGMIPIGALTFGGLLALGGAVGLTGDQRFLVPFAANAVTYLVSYAAIAGIPALGRRGPARQESGGDTDRALRVRDALRIPLVRAVLPATAAVTLGVGALFSVGVRFVEAVLHATPAQFGVLIAVFGVGAVGGLGASQRLHGDRLRQVRVGVAVLGVVIAAMSLAPTLWLAYVGAVLFGVSATATLVAGMTVLQTRLDGCQRDLGFTVFHVVIRGGLGAAAVVAGAVADALGKVGPLAGARVVLLVSGAVVVSSAPLVRSTIVLPDTDRPPAPLTRPPADQVAQ